MPISASPESLSSAASVLLGALGDGALRATLLVAVAWALTRSGRRSAADRHRAWSIVVACVVALPALLLAGVHPPAAMHGWSIGVSAVAIPRLPPPTDGVALFALAWLAGAALTASWFIAGYAVTRRALRSAVAERDVGWTELHRELRATLSVRTSVPLLRTATVSTPVTCGLWRPVVLLPNDTGAWPAELRRAVLLHELEHVRRRDAVTEVVAQVACVLFWFHPAVWLARHRMGQERELACDEATVRRGIDREAYAARLLELARLERWRDARLPAFGVAHPSQLRVRVTALLARPALPRDGGPTAHVCSALALLLTLCTLAVSPRGGAPRLAAATSTPSAVRSPPDVVPGAGPGSFRDAGAPRLRAFLGRR